RADPETGTRGRGKQRAAPPPAEAALGVLVPCGEASRATRASRERRTGARPRGESDEHTGGPSDPADAGQVRAVTAGGTEQTIPASRQPPGRVRRPTGEGSSGRRRRRKGRGRALRSGAASRGWGFKQAATAEPERRSGVPAGRGAPRGEGSNRQRRRSQGGRASRPGAASHGVRVQTGSNGAGRDGAGRPTRARRPTGRRFKQAATAKEGTGSSAAPGRSARPRPYLRRYRAESGAGRMPGRL